MWDHASTVVEWAKTIKNVKAVILSVTAGNHVNTDTGKQDIAHRALPSCSIIVVDVVQNILLCGGPFQDTTLIYGYILLAIVLVKCRKSHIYAT